MKRKKLLALSSWSISWNFLVLVCQYVDPPVCTRKSKLNCKYFPKTTRNLGRNKTRIVSLCVLDNRYTHLCDCFVLQHDHTDYVKYSSFSSSVYRTIRIIFSNTILATSPYLLPKYANQYPVPPFLHPYSLGLATLSRSPQRSLSFRRITFELRFPLFSSHDLLDGISFSLFLKLYQAFDTTTV